MNKESNKNLMKIKKKFKLIKQRKVLSTLKQMKSDIVSVLKILKINGNFKR